MLGVALKVIADWRVVFIAAAVIATIAILRYVGMVYHAKSRRGPPPGGGAPKPGSGAAPGKAGSPPPPSDAESGVVE